MDNDPETTIEAKVLAAVQAYRNKYGMKPDTCHIYHKLADEAFNVDGVVVLPVGRLVHHLLIGVTDNVS